MSTGGPRREIVVFPGEVRVRTGLRDKSGSRPAADTVAAGPAAIDITMKI